ncbi:MAG: hypothetical protein K8H84_07270 [Sulfuricella denitrificans]|nr:hypothetical protein [Sulfuricella denitrificans]
MNATIHAHPSVLNSPQAVAALEQITGMKAVICRAGVKLVSASVIDDYDLVDRQSYMSTMGAFAGDAA